MPHIISIYQADFDAPPIPAIPFLSYPPPSTCALLIYYAFFEALITLDASIHNIAFRAQADSSSSQHHSEWPIASAISISSLHWLHYHTRTYL